MVHTPMKNISQMSDLEIIQEARRRRRNVRDNDTLLEYRREQGTLAYYANTDRYPDGSEVTQGLSSVQHNIMRPCVDTITTYHVKAFLDEAPIEIKPTNLSMREKKKAEQNSKLLNAIWEKVGIGDFIRKYEQTSLINITGFAKPYWDDTPSYHKFTVPNTTEEDVPIVKQIKEEAGAQDVELVEIDEEGTGVFSCMLPGGFPAVDVLRPENVEVNIGTEAINSDKATHYVGHYHSMIAKNVVEMGKRWGKDIDPMLLADKATNISDEEDIREILIDYQDSSDQETGLLRKVELVECWMRWDDQESGMRHLIYSGDQLLLNEPWFQMIPITANNPYPVPHTLYGLGLWDKLKDKQTVLTALRRNAVDYSVMVSTHAMSPWISSMAGESAVRNVAQGRIGPRIVEDGVEKVSDAVMFPALPAQPGNQELIAENVRKEVISEIGIDYIAGVVSADIEKSGNDQEKTSMVMDNASTKIEEQISRLANGSIKEISLAWLEMLIENKDKTTVKALIEMVTPGEPFYAAQDNSNVIEKLWQTTKVKAGIGHISRDLRVQRMLMIQQQQTDVVTKGGFVPPHKLALPAMHITQLMDEDPFEFFADKNEMMQHAQMTAMQQKQQGELTAQAAQADLKMNQEKHQADMRYKLAQTAEIIAKTKNITFEEALEQAKFEWDKEKDLLEAQIELKQERGVSL